MKIIRTQELPADRVVRCTGCTSHRLVLDSDNMGYAMTKTIVPPGGRQFWHYKDHLESCFCVSGKGALTDVETGEEILIEPDTTYVLDKHDPHYFEAIEETILICVFNPPLIGDETHDEDGSYALPGFRSPVYDVKSVPISQVTANDYNPNRVAPPEMELLETSIWEDGYTQPIVTVYDPDNDKYVVVDGFHRFLILRDSVRIREREGGMLPVVVLKKDRKSVV